MYEIKYLSTPPTSLETFKPYLFNSDSCEAGINAVLPIIIILL